MRCGRSVAMVVSRPRHLLRTRSCICAVSISKVCAHGGRACCKDQRPVTQQFNTTTSMGRLTLNVLLSFAQFEREVTSERIRDKIAASKRKGLWVGGPLPLGYAMKDGKIAVVEDEAERVRLIYRRYLELGGVNALVRDLNDKDIRTKIRVRATGATHGGIPFDGQSAHFAAAAKAFHWMIVALLIVQYPLGWFIPHIHR